MARIAGVNIPTQKRVVIALQYIHGIGPKFAEEICTKVGIPAERRVNQLTDAEVLQIREAIDRDYVVEGDLRREVAMNIKRLMDLGCYRGLRHRRGLPVRGQRTHTNARTRKGKARPIAGKKKVDQVSAATGASRRRHRVLPPPHATRRLTRSWSLELQWPKSSSSKRPRARSRRREKKNITSGVAHVNASLQQHDDHHHRRAGQHHRLVVVGHDGLQGLAQVDALRRPDGGRGRRQEGAGARHEDPRGRGHAVRARAASRRCARCRPSASRSPRSAT